MKTKRLLPTLLFVCCGWAPLSIATPFTNGSFETPNIPTFSQYPVAGGPAPWVFTVNGGLLSDATGYIGPADVGNQYMELNVPAGLGTMQQTFDVLANHKYRLTFDLSGVADGSADQFNVDIIVTGGVTSHFGFNTGSAANLTLAAWKPEEYDFTTGLIQTSATLTVVSTLFSSSLQFYGPAVDNFVLTDDLRGVPEPATLALLGLGLAGLGFSRRKSAQA